MRVRRPVVAALSAFVSSTVAKAVAITQGEPTVKIATMQSGLGHLRTEYDLRAGNRAARIRRSPPYASRSVTPR